MRARHCLVWILVLLPLSSASPQSSPSGPRAILPRSHEIALARSAAPAEVSRNATVLALTPKGFEVAERGSNGVTCLVNRSQPESLEPECFDPEGSQTIMPMEVRRTEQLQAGRSPRDIDREIADGVLSGKYRFPRRPAMIYMLSSAQVLFSEEGKRVGQWHPHLMIYYPGLTAADLGLRSDSTPQGPVIVDHEGKPQSTIIIIQSAFVDPAPE